MKKKRFLLGIMLHSVECIGETQFNLILKIVFEKDPPIVPLQHQIVYFTGRNWHFVFEKQYTITFNNLCSSLFPSILLESRL
jgi:hypothetical protein